MDAPEPQPTPGPDTPSGPSTAAEPSRPERSAAAWQLTLVVALGLLIALTSFAAGILAERDIFDGGWAGINREIGSLGSDAEPVSDPDFPLLREVQDLIEDEYFDRPLTDQEKDAFRERFERGAVAAMSDGLADGTPSAPAEIDAFLKDLEYDAIVGATEAVGDDYTAFLAPPEQAPFAEQMAGEYEGIGVQIEQPEGRLTVVAPFPGSPAERAGIRPGDVLEAADDQPLSGISVEDARNLIRGPAGTTVRLTIRRPNVPEPFVVEVVRAAITTPAVMYHPAAGGDVAWLQVSIFNDKTTEQLDAALKRAKDEGVQGIVLDLRNNGGGWVRSAQEMIGRFVPADRGPALYEDDNVAPDNDPREEPIIGGGEEVFDLPLVVLVNEGTASAAEIVAGALRDYGRAKLVGAPTYGKGSVQRVHDFPDGSSLRVTFARWLTPKRQPIPEEGLVPDIPVGLASASADAGTVVGDVVGGAPAAGTPTPVDQPAVNATPTDIQLDRAIEEVLAEAP